MEQLYRQGDMPFDAAAARGMIEELREHPEWGSIWSIEADSQAAGYFVLTLGYSLEFGGRFALLDEFLVDGPWRGRGLGTQALEFMAAWCRQSGIPALRLEVGYENDRAIELYRRVGFVAHDRHFMTRLI